MNLIIKNICDSMISIDGGVMQMGDRHEQYEPWFYGSIERTNILIFDFLLCNHPVTEKEWYIVMENKDIDSNIPISNKSWHQVQGFINKLNNITQRQFRLPTEAEWEYAARGGIYDKDYIFSGGNEIEELGWYFWNTSNSSKQSVMKKKPNQLGLYDMTGNVWEWCSDWYDSSYEKGEKPILGLFGERDWVLDPQGPRKGAQKVYRGGSYANLEKKCWLFRRDYDAPDYRSERIGFRIAESIIVDE